VPFLPDQGFEGVRYRERCVMDRRTFMQALSICAAAGAGRAFAGGKEGPPNFVFFLADDLGWADTGYNGSEFYETPAIDRLSSEGVTFTDAYAACPVCSPTRASIMTGKYPARIGLTDYIGGVRSGRLVPPKNLDHLPHEETTVAEAFKRAGYKNYFIGKWHLGGKDYYPDKQGFDVNIGGTWMGMPSSGYFAPYRIPTLPEGPDGEYLTDRLTEDALKCIDQAGSKPFMLFLSHFAVHIPIQAKEEIEDGFEEKAEEMGLDDHDAFDKSNGRKTRVLQSDPEYAAMLYSLDKSLERVMAKLDEKGLSDNTVIIFMSDNGGLSTAEGRPTSNLPLRAGKGWLYEGGIREPMIIKWPGVTDGGGVCAEPVTSTDFYPTMLEMAGLPPLPDQHLDGTSLAPLLKGESSLGRDAIFWHYPHYSNQGGRPSAAVRAGEWKLIEFFEDDRVELYNLAEDIGEEDDLSEKMPKKTEELKKMLHGWQESVSARMPGRNWLHPLNLVP